MIVFDLHCEEAGHVFEGWFGSSAEYEAQQASGLVACPICGSARIEKAPMAPAIAGPKGSLPAPAETKRLLAEMAKMQKEILKNSEAVGTRFPAEARAIHLGEAEARAIHGQASAGEAEALREEGIAFSPLPFPVVEPAEEN